MKHQSGFTLLEIAIATGIMAVIAGVVIVAINPARQFAQARNGERSAKTSLLLGAIDHYTLDQSGRYPAGIDSTLRMIGTSTTGCAVACAAQATTVGSFSDTDAGSINGTFSNTYWLTSSSSVLLTSSGISAGTGSYTSPVKDSGGNFLWTTYSWVPAAPYGKELPNNLANESAYSKGNAVMTGNVLLYHMNEASGSLIDNSGSGNTGSVVGTIGYSATGKLRTGISFGGSSYIQLPTATSLKLPDTGGSVFTWVYFPTSVNLAQDTGMSIIRKPDYCCNPPAPGGYGLELYRGTPGSPQVLKGHLGNNNGFTNTFQNLVGTTPVSLGAWHHVGLTWTSSTMYLYLDGAIEASAARTASLTWVGGNSNAYIGYWQAGISNGRSWLVATLDETALFNRTLSATEAAHLYLRGALRLRHQIRACNDSACSGESFVGPTGLTTDYYEELNNSGLGLPSFTITSQPLNRYFQYRTVFETDSALYSPELRGITITNNSGAGSGPETTADACLNLGSLLVPTYITALPIDPVSGTSARTYYAVKKTGMDNLVVKACGAELGATIEARHQ